MTLNSGKVPLRKKLSVAFGKGKKRVAVGSSSRDSIQIMPDDEAADAAGVAAEVQLSSLQEEALDLGALKAEHQQTLDELNAMLESLQTHCDKLEQTHLGDQAEIVRCQSDLRQSQVKIQQLELSSARQKEQLLQLLPRLQVIDAERAQAEELRSDIRKYQAWAVRVNERENADKRNIQNLEEQLHYIVASAEKPIADVLRDRSDLMDKLVSLERQLAICRATFDTERKALEEKLSRLETTCDAAVAESSTIKDKVANLQAQLSEGKWAADISAKTITNLRAEKTRISDDLKVATSTISALNSMAGSGFTPRMLLALKLVANTRPAATGDHCPGNLLPSCLSGWSQGISLDSQLSETDLSRFVNELSSTEDGQQLCQALAMQTCSLCGLLKFTTTEKYTGACRISEFSDKNNKTACCLEAVCSDCYLMGLVRTLKDDWWRDLASASATWMKCPVPACESALELRHGVDGLRRILLSVGDCDLASHIEMHVHPPTPIQFPNSAAQLFSNAFSRYERAQAFRSALAKMVPNPTAEALGKASEVHRLLIARGTMYSYLEASLTSFIPDETGRIPPFNPGTVRLHGVDHEGGSLEIPFFVKLFRRSSMARECVVCAESMYEIKYGSTEQWIETCDGINGDWMWRVLLFPAKLALECKHEIDTCRDCLSTHLETQLTQFGRSHCDELACPSEMCSRKLSYDEVRLYANQETFEK